MNVTDVSILFPGKEKVKRTHRGRLPQKYILAPSYEEMVRTAYEVLLVDKQSQGRSSVTFFLLRKEGFYGYMKITEDSQYPISTACNSYPVLQNVYDDILHGAKWHVSLETLIETHSSRSTARIKNDVFIQKIREEFLTKKE